MNEKILLIDDEKGIVVTMKNYFEMSGYQVYIAYNGYNKTTNRDREVLK